MNDAGSKAEIVRNASAESLRLLERGEKSAALLALRKALALVPGDPGLLADLGGIYLISERFEEAKTLCEQALQGNPEHSQALVNLATAQQGLKQWSLAEALYRRVLKTEPTSAVARFGLARLLLLIGNISEAETLLKSLLTEHPSDGEAWLDLGYAHARMHQFAEAEADYRRALNALSNSAEARWNLGVLHLLQGDYARGWQEYEARWDTAGFASIRRDFQQPRWRGEPFPGKTLLVHSEQGFGDTLMFSRFLEQARSRGGRVVLEGAPELREILSRCQGVDAWVNIGDPLPPFDIQIPLHSLAQIFAQDLSLASCATYLEVPESVPHRNELESMIGTEKVLKVGVVWAGNPNHMADAHRSIHPECLSVLGESEPIRWFSLQVGATEFPSLPGLVDLSVVLQDFSDTAFAISRLDLILCVDTAVAHLAGALGKRAWVLLPWYPDWRWLLDRSDSPWYPTLRLYRQERPGEWGPVLKRVAEDLQSECGTC